jgi:DMSO reductase anchor subunit
MPAAGQTISTTRITLPEHSSTWLERVDTGSIRPEHSHPSLIVLTCAMQAIFGAFTSLCFSNALTLQNTTLLFILTAGALNVSVFHLGRPAYAWRAVRMWRRSWLSREVVLFGIFFASVALATSAQWALRLSFQFATLFIFAAQIAAVIFGFLGTIASAFVYRVKARPAWNMSHTPLDFLLSAAMMGIALAATMQTHLSGLHMVLNPVFELVTCIAWIANQITRLLRLKQSTNFESRATYNLLRSQSLWWASMCSLACASAVIAFTYIGFNAGALIAAVLAVALARYLFFVSVVPVSMALTFLKAPQAHGAAA